MSREEAKAFLESILHCLSAKAQLAIKKLLEQEPVLDKIEAEIDSAYEGLDEYDPDALPTFLSRVERIIDKYKVGE